MVSQPLATKKSMKFAEKKNEEKKMTTEWKNRKRHQRKKNLEQTWKKNVQTEKKTKKEKKD